MKFLGRHVSMSNLRSELRFYGINAAQVFTKPPQQWFGKPLYEEQVLKYDPEKFYVCAHAGYLINLANVESQSKSALLHEAHRCAQIGIPDLVVHPGSGDARDVIASLNAIGPQWPHNVRLLLENTAGQGRYIGGTLDELQYIIDHVACPIPLGICYDTAHAFGYGLDIMSTIHHHMVKLVHLNDSAVPMGSRKDRHANLGHGHMSRGLMYGIIKTVEVPCIMETPEAFAVEDLNVLREMLGHQA